MFANEIGVTNVTNCTFFGNSAQGIGGGGAIHNQVVANSNVTNSTFSDNSAGAGGGAIWNEGSATLRNTIITKSTVSNCFGTFEAAGTNNMLTNDQQPLPRFHSGDYHTAQSRPAGK